MALDMHLPAYRILNPPGNCLDIGYSCILRGASTATGRTQPQQQRGDSGVLGAGEWRPCLGASATSMPQSNTVRWGILSVSAGRTSRWLAGETDSTLAVFTVAFGHRLLPKRHYDVAVRRGGAVGGAVRLLSAVGGAGEACAGCTPPTFHQQKRGERRHQIAPSCSHPQRGQRTP